MRRYVVVGAGAVGGAIGGALALAGHDVVLVARGAHLEAVRARRLRRETPRATHVLAIAAVDRLPAPGTQDVIVIATKTQDTGAALAPLADRRVPIVCAQNGVANERFAAERSERVLGAVVFAPLQHLTPGVVSIHAAPGFGGIDLGLWPTGDDPLATTIAEDLCAAGFDVRVRSDIARWKYGKLLTNLGNVLDALGGRAVMTRAWLATANDEAEACLRAAGIAFVGEREIHERFADVHETSARAGGSTWQSLARGASLETEWLNGEIVRLGAAHGVPTPMNAALVALAQRATVERWAPGTRSIDELAAWLPASRRT